MSLNESIVENAALDNGSGTWAMRPGTSRISRPLELPAEPGIPDEAHRSQYGFGGKVNEKTGEMSYGFASNLRDALPNASFIGSTGTPIKKTEANKRAV